jgi:hypothetical protein
MIARKGLAQPVRQDGGIAQMRETGSVGASIDFLFARPTFKRLQLVGAAVERMRVRLVTYIVPVHAGQIGPSCAPNLICIIMAAISKPERA